MNIRSQSTRQKRLYARSRERALWLRAKNGEEKRPHGLRLLRPTGDETSNSKSPTKAGAPYLALFRGCEKTHKVPQGWLKSVLPAHIRAGGRGRSDTLHDLRRV